MKTKKRKIIDGVEHKLVGPVPGNRWYVPAVSEKQAILAVLRKEKRAAMKEGRKKSLLDGRRKWLFGYVSGIALAESYILSNEKLSGPAKETTI